MGDVGERIPVQRYSFIKALAVNEYIAIFVVCLFLVHSIKTKPSNTLSVRNKLTIRLTVLRVVLRSVVTPINVDVYGKVKFTGFYTTFQTHL